MCQPPVQLHLPHHSPGAHTRVRPSPRHSSGSMLANPARLFGHASNQLNHSTPPIVPGQPGFNVRSSPSAASILSIMCRHVPNPPPSPSPQESCRLSRLPANSPESLPTDCPYTTPANWPLTPPWLPNSKVLANHTVEADNTQPQHYTTHAGPKNEVKRRGNALPQTIGPHNSTNLPRNIRSTAIIA